jgi:hypothetical protein
MSAQNELFKKLYGHPQPTKEELFAELYTVVAHEEYSKFLKKIADAADERTRELREARDKMRKAYSKLNTAYDLCWREAWAQARAEMVLEEVE